jgi:hypothetical protein|nr:MAG TPA: antitermination protein Q [Caudoviricetes sp.]
MITKEQEQRLRNWARANRECPRVKKGATLVFCESLRYWYDHEAEEGDDEPPTRPPQAERRGIDVDDANLIDRAYRDREMRNISRAVLRMFYCEKRHPRDIERELSLGEKTLNMHRERAVNQIFRIVESLEKEA